MEIEEVQEQHEERRLREGTIGDSGERSEEVHSEAIAHLDK